MVAVMLSVENDRTVSNVITTLEFYVSGKQFATFHCTDSQLLSPITLTLGKLAQRL